MNREKEDAIPPLQPPLRACPRTHLVHRKRLITMPATGWPSGKQTPWPRRDIEDQTAAAPHNTSSFIKNCPRKRSVQMHQQMKAERRLKAAGGKAGIGSIGFYETSVRPFGRSLFQHGRRNINAGLRIVQQTTGTTGNIHRGGSRTVPQPPVKHMPFHAVHIATIAVLEPVLVVPGSKVLIVSVNLIHRESGQILWCEQKARQIRTGELRPRQYTPALTLFGQPYHNTIPGNRISRSRARS